MTIPEILKELEPYTGRFPMEAMKAAIEQREAVTPELLGVLEAAAENPVEFAKRKNYMVHEFALFLLAQFREKRAYAPIVKMFSAPGETPFDLAGDTVTEGLCRIFASVYDGNPAPLQGLIENEDVNGFVRSAAINAFQALEHSGEMPRDEVVGYFRSLFHGKLQRQHSYAWDSLVCAVADLPAAELIEDARKAFADDLIDPMVTDLEGIEADLVAQKPWRREHFYIITDAIGEMSWWHSFRKDDLPLGTPPTRKAPLWPASDPDLDPAYEDATPQPFVRAAKIGRNERCPCGSGKKYKKCCGKG